MITTETQVIWEPGDLRHIDENVDAWLRDLVDDTVDFAAERLREHAPGAIDALVESEGGQFDPQLDAIEGVAGVIPDPTEEYISKSGSRRSDYPYYVDVGTGIYGPEERPITSMPGGVMGPIEFRGRMLYLTSIRGQEAQDFSGAATRDTDLWLLGHIRATAKRIGEP